MLNLMLAAIQFVTVDPGHFHAALVQNRTYEGVSPNVLVYAPDGGDLKSHLSLIDQFNARAENPTAWKETVCADADFLKKFTEDAAKCSAAQVQIAHTYSPPPHSSLADNRWLAYCHLHTQLPHNRYRY